jgi:ATP-dependent protease Clp ATPase subunit
MIASATETDIDSADLIKAGLVPPLIGKMPGLLIEKEAPRQDETDDP